MFFEGIKSIELIDFDKLLWKVLFEVKKRFKDVCKKVIEVVSNKVLCLIVWILVMEYLVLVIILENVDS